MPWSRTVNVAVGPPPSTDALVQAQTVPAAHDRRVGADLDRGRAVLELGPEPGDDLTHQLSELDGLEIEPELAGLDPR
jgi:hypothetical protein